MESPSIQSIQSNGSIDALCIYCNKIKSLEACLHCMQPICSECRDVHFEAWRCESSKFCDHINQKINRYLTKMNGLNSLMDQNSENIVKVKDQIEETFQNFIKQLTQQKEDLFNKLDEIEKENKEFEQFETEIKGLKDKFDALQIELNDNSKQISMPEFEKFRNCREEVHKIGVGYSDLKKKSFKIIGEYEKPQSAEIDPNFFGNLIIADTEILKPQRDSTKNKHQQKPKSPDMNQKAPLVAVASDDNFVPMNNTNGKIAMFGTLRVKLKRIAEQMNELQSTVKKPIVEFDLKLMPKFIANYHRNIYIADEEGNLCIAELGNSLAVKLNARLALTSVKGLAVNKKYMAVSFHDLTNEQVASIRSVLKKFEAKSGVLLYKIGSHDFGLSFEKLISSSKSHTLIAPAGIALNESSLFVCDRELHAVFKIDVKSGSFVQKLITTDQEPVSIAVGEKYFVYTDGLKLELNLVDMDKFTILKTVKFSEELFYEPFDVAYKENAYIFVKNKADTKLIVYDAATMSVKYSFDYDYSNSQAISYVKLKDDYLLLGYWNSVTNSFKMGLFSDI